MLAGTRYYAAQGFHFLFSYLVSFQALRRDFEEFANVFKTATIAVKQTFQSLAFM